VAATWVLAPWLGSTFNPSTVNHHEPDRPPPAKPALTVLTPETCTMHLLSRPRQQNLMYVTCCRISETTGTWTKQVAHAHCVVTFVVTCTMQVLFMEGPGKWTTLRGNQPFISPQVGPISESLVHEWPDDIASILQWERPDRVTVNEETRLGPERHAHVHLRAKKGREKVEIQTTMNSKVSVGSWLCSCAL
ncbi:hypothetical protein E4U34_007378, partial [Claviceps purpurea]